MMTNNRTDMISPDVSNNTGRIIVLFLYTRFEKAGLIIYFHAGCMGGQADVWFLLGKSNKLCEILVKLVHKVAYL